MTIERPQQVGDHEFACAFEITGLATEVRRSVRGIDAVQALQLAMQAIGAHLYLSAEYGSARLAWGDVGGNPKDLGFPVPDALKDIPPGPD